MNTKLLMPTIISAALGAFFFTHPADARNYSSFFNGLTGNAQYQGGYGNRGNNTAYGNRSSCHRNQFGSGFNNNNNNVGYNQNNWSGRNNYNRGNGLFAQDQNLYAKEQRLQQRLAQGNLTPDQAARLQNRLSSLQSQQVGLNGQLTSQLVNEQTRLQSLLSSGTLNPYQQSQLQNRLTRLQAEQNGIASGTPFTGGILNGLRSSFGF